VMGLLALLESRHRLAQMLRDGVALLFIAALIVWAFYRFEVRPWPGGALPLPATTYLLNLRTLI
ncbi:MAG: hypothetical protein GWN58_36195, partial [Anaerolineae bacterium]|nr:hypothetical protein [Anaerolineae bacterium]